MYDDSAAKHILKMFEKPVSTSGWRGCSDVGMTSNGTWGDPDLNIEYDGKIYIFNYWDIENALWDMFLEENGISETDTYVPGTYNISDEWEQKFDEYCQDNAYSYMEDCIYGGYFTDGSYSWHDRYN